MSFLVIGVIAGLVLGLTGGGGAVVSVPLFIHLAGLNLKQATTLGILTVFVGSTLNSISQRKFIHLQTAIILALISLVSSKLFSGIKQELPEIVLQGLFVVICSVVLTSVWKKKKPSLKSKKNEHPIVSEPQAIVIRRGDSVLLVIMGFFVGMMATLVGLSGGLVLVPFLNSVMKMPLAHSVATSLLAIALAAIGSVGVQWKTLITAIELHHGLLLGLGLLGAPFLSGHLLRKISAHQREQIRKWLFTTLLILASVGVLVKR